MLSAVFYLVVLILFYDLYYFFHFYVFFNIWKVPSPIPVTQVDLKDAFLFWKQKLNYYIHFFICIYDLFHLRLYNENRSTPLEVEHAVIQLILNSTAVIHLRLEQDHYVL